MVIISIILSAIIFAGLWQFHFKEEIKTYKTIWDFFYDFSDDEE